MASLRSRTSPWRQTFDRLTATAAPVRPATRSFAPRSRTMSTFPSSSSGSSSSGSSSGSRSGFRLTPTTAVLCCVPILTAYLGVWQVQRLKWKLGLIADVDRNLSKDPMVLPNEINPEALSDYAFRRVILHGHFAQPIMLVGPRVYEGAGGYHLIQPFIRTPVDSNTSGSAPTLKNKKKKESSFSFWRKDDEAEEAAALLSESNRLDARSTDGSVDDGSMTPILVNRGFISTARAQEYRLNPSLVPLFSPSVQTSSETVPTISNETKSLYIQTLLRPPSEIKAGAKPAFTPDNNKENNEWFYIDLEAMKEWVEGKGVNKVQGVLVDEIYEGETPASQLIQQGIPVGRPLAVELRNQHAMYAGTWFSLSFFTSIMLARLFWTKGKVKGQGVGRPAVGVRRT
ncbi:hypothetical protein FFLO_01643 [Filobasidium floriforme]|uniref:SURF1-like protein n=1 Tax=Filobasidium floriforme TaxID=5210 RepID=A0A8K0NPV8_9TREE|nr:putative mitochondrial protein required for respiration [Filobasidium floriforme]KAG7562953.1 hypothetical protein FFLO_01643 [Filobasidium floriforme]KAH8080594.1 putative mitochondrial protein required for respiration [Filobasidium floriforme]